MKQSWLPALETPWAMLAITGVLFGLVALFVDLKPVVTEGFFFSVPDPQFRQSKKIEKRFPAPTEILLNVASNDISSPRYLERIGKLTREIQEIDAVSSVKSLTNGPKNFQDAVESPALFTPMS